MSYEQKNSEGKVGRGKDQGGDYTGLQNRIFSGNRRVPKTSQLFADHKRVPLARINKTGRNGTVRGNSNIYCVRQAACDCIKKTAQHIRKGYFPANKEFKPAAQQSARNSGSLQGLQIGQIRAGKCSQGVEIEGGGLCTYPSERNLTASKQVTPAIQLV